MNHEGVITNARNNECRHLRDSPNLRKSIRHSVPGYPAPLGGCTFPLPFDGYFFVALPSMNVIQFVPSIEISNFIV
jgi:hypothetical protein